MTDNYRSAPAVLETALAVIRQNPGGDRVLIPHRAAGPAVRRVQAADSFSEAVFIAKEIGRMTGGVDMLDARPWTTSGPPGPSPTSRCSAAPTGSWN